ncbi:spc19p [Saccharomyces arboricola H-6]|uniref:DASH complex subunit SPC19 n=1 Tax=Saccharomyces arboricola (strain H-6 / AS 2.3317 / CBS 10644) TaxID=1160507 RepID=J8Q432_SACAR|nr:spc19p [Saccharomyces arboricola H-6]
MTDALEQSVLALEKTVSVLKDSVESLKHANEPSTNLSSTMLHTKRVFRLVPEYDVERSKLDLIEEVEPLVRTLGDKLRKSMGRMQRELDTLKQTYELNDLRLKKNINMEDDGNGLNSSEAGREDEGGDADVSTDVVMMASSTNEELEELKKLKGIKKQLENKLQILKQK